MPKFDAIVIGTGQAGPSLASRLADDGRKTAVIEREAFRRDLRQHRLHSDRGAGGERGGRTSHDARPIMASPWRAHRGEHEGRECPQGAISRPHETE